eukprot:gnl/MRDRNA2_/MRDRNA2_17551_c0_seq1.p1 gnl/MRDRNA2_/MRDRNA2_17551_c0~~gnl/MRDRNA2_/MRDRNA2_17551_c0_seq1.p1  ORF type:complete len:167 (-),score=38.75 gnl/MRDRNA2_/MRDRNA2_17551_c0_seq1:15-515(-)
MPHLIASGHGAIVNCSSIQASRAYSNYPAYAAAKAGILGLTRQLAVQYAGKNVRVNAVSPGPVATNLEKNSLTHEPDFLPIGNGDNPNPADLQEVAENGPPSKKPRLFTRALPEDVGHCILFLASHEAAAVTGIDLPVDGGFAVKGLSEIEQGIDPAEGCKMAAPS